MTYEKKGKQWCRYFAHPRQLNYFEKNLDICEIEDFASVNRRDYPEGHYFFPILYRYQLLEGFDSS